MIFFEIKYKCNFNDLFKYIMREEKESKRKEKWKNIF